MKRWQVVVDLVRANGWRAGAEIGVYAGETLHALLKHCRRLTMIAVDPLEPQRLTLDSLGDDGTKYRNTDWAALRKEMQKRCNRWPDRLTWHKMRSQEAAAKIEEDSLDFVFIDADHAQASVEQDIMAWTPKIKRGGWLTGHDCDLPSVRRALDRLLTGWTEHPAQVWTISIAKVRL